MELTNLENTAIEFIDGDRGKNYPKQSDFSDRGFCLFLSAKNVTDNGFLFEEKSFISQIKDYELRKGKLERGDIVITTRGTIGNVALFDDKVPFEHVRINSGMVIARNKDKQFCNEFINIFLNSYLFKNQVGNLISGSAVPQLPIKDIKKIKIPVFSLQKQKKIIEIIGTLEEKISLNTQINQTLEQIAQTIFKSWFIDFDPVTAKAEVIAQGKTAQQANLAAMEVISGKTFEELDRLQVEKPTEYQQLWELAEAFPSGFEEVEGVGEVPKGWGVKSSEQLFDVAIGKTPPRKEPEWFSENPNDIQWISIKDMGNASTYITKSSEYLTKEAVERFNVKRIPNNTVLLSFKLTVGRVCISTQETTTNEAIAHFLIGKKSVLTTEYLYLFLKKFNFNDLGSTSSIATAVNSKTIKEMRILEPSSEVIKQFQIRIEPFFKAIRNNIEEISSLESIRDSLLPKLLSGEL
ncbi:hypothetical protein A1D22_04685 [Pasteurellaceae bacterium LFhippo2]|nr:hypothetical protein [Pasteurellaceae bacterium LFhippo2]